MVTQYKSGGEVPVDITQSLQAIPGGRYQGTCDFLINIQAEIKQVGLQLFGQPTRGIQQLRLQNCPKRMGKPQALYGRSHARAVNCARGMEERLRLQGAATETKF